MGLKEKGRREGELTFRLDPAARTWPEVIGGFSWLFCLVVLLYLRITGSRAERKEQKKPEKQQKWKKRKKRLLTAVSAVLL